jgi:predicted esterase
MYKHIATVLILAGFCYPSYSQQTGKIRYRDVVFEHITVQRDVHYYTPAGSAIKEKYCLMDVYEPYNDTSLKRPLVIWMHGGGFKFGKKESGGIPAWSRNFAGRGYVCAAINYRLNKEEPLRDYKALVSQCMLAIKDLQKAVDFFKQYREEYRVDTSCIILGGNSAGAMIALQTVYSSFYEMNQKVNSENADQQSKVHNPMNIKAVVSFWGALFDINWLQNENIPIVSVHGRKDKVVFITTKDSLFFGSASIHQRADELGIPNSIKIYENHAHELQKIFLPLWFSNAVKRRWREAGDFAADFLYKQLFKQ